MKRKRSAEDARQVEVHLTAKGERALHAIAAAQSGELKALAGYIKAAATKAAR